MRLKSTCKPRKSLKSCLTFYPTYDWELAFHIYIERESSLNPARTQALISAVKIRSLGRRFWMTHNMLSLHELHLSYSSSNKSFVLPLEIEIPVDLQWSLPWDLQAEMTVEL